MASAGDVNGDGYGDVIVGAFGVVYVYMGGATGLSMSRTVTLLAPLAGNGSSFGFAVAGAGDVNGDGYGDVVVGASDAGVDDGPGTCTSEAQQVYQRLLQRRSRRRS